MRHFVIAFIIFWLTGIALGIYAVGLPITLIAAVLAGGFFNVQKWCCARGVAATILVLTGYVYASSVRPGSATCSLTPLFVAQVLEQDIEIQRVRYVVEDEHGCRLSLAAARFPLYVPGDTVEVAGAVRPVSELALQSPGYAAYLVRRGIGATVSYPHIKLISRGDYVHEYLSTAVRERIARLLPEPDASLVMALLFAEQGTVPPHLQEYYRATGTSHILAISGLQISLLAGMVFVALSLLPLSPLIKTAATLSLLWIYVWFIGAPVSAVRALFFWTFTLFAMQLGMLMPLASVLLLTVAFMISQRPAVLLDIGFQLSVSAVVGMGVTLFLALPFLRIQGFTKWVSGLLLASVGATLGTLPLVTYHFGTLSLIGVVINMFVVPPQPVLLALGLLTLALSFFAAPAALLVGFLLHMLLAGMNEIVRLGSLVPGVWFTDVYWPAWAVGTYYAVLAGASVGIVAWQGRSWREIWT